MIKLGPRSLARLEGVHPDLVRVVKRAAEMATPDLDFTILEGVRSVEQMYRNYGQGRTVAQCRAKGVPIQYAEPSKPKVTWLANPLASKHALQLDRYGHAVDLAPYPIDWSDLKRFRAMVSLIKRAAADCRVQIACGADWKRKDYPHVEIVR